MSTYDASTRLENFLAVAEPALARLDVDHLQNEVLDRVRDILGADTAAVLMHEQGADYLVARAARGLEEEVRQGVRVPIGAGFAGRIAQTKRPVRLRQVDASTVANPILWEKGIQRMLGVPLLSGDEVLGVLHVGRLERHDFDASDEALLQVAAERLIVAVQNRRYADEVAASDLLERSLLPSRLPQVMGAQLASRYVPTESRAIGGDWFDTFVGPDKALWMVTGDVAGHGLRAAVVMGRVKSALRAYSLLGDGPARVLELTDRKVVHFEMGTMITVVCARAYPPFETWTISSAGHPPPVLAAPGRSTVLADVPPDPPLGARPGCLRTETTVLLPPGGLLLLYTDGLVERRDEVIDVGLGRLRSVVAAGHPEAVCGTVMHELVGSGRPMDDIALLAVRRDEGEADASAPRTCEFEPEATAPRAARRFAREAAGPLSEADQQTLELLVSELVSNAVIHAVTPVELTVTRSEVAIRVEVSDRSAAEVRLQPARPTATHGRGLLIVSALADTWGVRNRNSPPGKTVWCTLAINGTPLPDRPDGPWPEVAA